MSLAPLEELFRARVITFLVKKGLLPPERARMLRGWAHSGFNVHRSHRVPPSNREDMERLAHYIIRNPFSVDKMQPNSSGNGRARSDGSHFQPPRPPGQPFRDSGRVPHHEMAVACPSNPDLPASVHGNTRFQLQTPGQRPGGSKAISYQLSFLESKGSLFG